MMTCGEKASFANTDPSAAQRPADTASECPNIAPITKKGSFICFVHTFQIEIENYVNTGDKLINSFTYSTNGAIFVFKVNVILYSIL